MAILSIYSFVKIMASWTDASDLDNAGYIQKPGGIPHSCISGNQPFYNITFMNLTYSIYFYKALINKGSRRPIYLRNNILPIIDGFVKSPDAALRCILRRCSVPKSTLHSSGFARLACELFTKPSEIRLFTRASLFIRNQSTTRTAT